MGLIEQAKQDVMSITSNLGDFGLPLVFTAPTGETASITGIAMKHNTSVDEVGRIVKSKTAHISFSEKLLTDLSYPVRNAGGNVVLKNHKVRYSDSSGQLITYIIREWFPDETIGLITCILGEFE